MSKISRRAKELKSMGDHDKFLERIQKTLYYGKLPATDRLSLPITELACELFSEPQQGKSLNRLHCRDAAYITREACISPCSFVLAMLYLERLKSCNPEYLQNVAPSQLFLVSLMVSSKFLYDSGEDGDVVMGEWAMSGDVSVEELITLEREFLNAIQWDIFVKELTFWQKLNSLELTLAKREGCARGHFTYTELKSLLQLVDVHSLIHAIAGILAVLVTTYTAGILTIMSSMFIASQIPGHCLHQPSAVRNTSVDNNDSMPIYNNNLFDRDYARPSQFNDFSSIRTNILLDTIEKSIDRMADDYNNISNEDATWNWWNCPTMEWLSHASRIVEVVPLFSSDKFTSDRFIDMSIANSKKIALEDKWHRATKVRRQDQMESSWHTEWKDTISDYLSYELFTHYFQDVKA